MRGVHVSIVELQNELLLASLDEDMAQAARQLVEKSRTPIFTGHTAVRINGERRAESIVIEEAATGHRRELPADIVLISTGTRGSTELAVKAGCALGVTGQIKVNSRCETSVPGICAAGDCT